MINTNIYIHNPDIYKSDDNNCNNYYNDNKKNIIKKYSFFLINEITICSKISKIQYYSNYFSILEDYEELKLYISSCDNNENDNDKYYLIKYNDDYCYDFIDYIYSSTSIKKFIFNTINSFKHILNGLILLNKNNICYFNISPKNVFFLNNFREKPILTNFKNSLRTTKLNFNYIKNIFHKIEDLTYQPFEIHILYFLYKSNSETISYSIIDDFCDNFIDNFHILNLFSNDYKIKYKKKCIDFLKKYINMSIEDIIQNILERKNKWDVYGISMIFLKIFSSIYRTFGTILKGTFITNIIVILSKNLDPDSCNRLTLDTTFFEFDKLLNEELNWYFVNKLDNKKLDNLFDELSK